ncbi:MAG: hypothetical protein Q4D51_03330 [Eubacteriales bacterium]|nr:hypothetical protein [Eubacteriales bacterium]
MILISRADEILNGNYDFDGESKDFKRTIGKACIAFGILALIFNSYFFVKVLKVVVGGESFQADIVRGRVFTVAEYKDGDKTYQFDLNDTIISDKKTKIRMYYKGEIKEAITINWGVYAFSYLVYLLILVSGILNVKNIGIKDLIRKITSKKK